MNLTTLLAFRFLFFFVILLFRPDGDPKKTCTPIVPVVADFALGGVVHVLVSIFYAISVQRLPASLTGLIFYLYPAMVTGLALLIGWEKTNRLKLTALIVCFAGLLQVLGVSLGVVSTSGLLFGVAAAFVQACHVLLGHTILTNLSPLLTVGWSAAATSAAFFWVWDIVGRFAVESAAGC